MEGALKIINYINHKNLINFIIINFFKLTTDLLRPTSHEGCEVHSYMYTDQCYTDSWQLIRHVTSG